MRGRKVNPKHAKSTGGRLMSRIDASIRPLRETDLSAADRILRLAFGTFLGLPDPMTLWKGVDYVRTRWLAEPSSAFAAEVGSQIVGSNFVTSWGSVGFFGPLTIRPDLWDKGIAKQLLEPTMALFDKWGTKHVGLFTFAHSPKHVGLYQKFGFLPRFLTMIMSKSTSQSPRNQPAWSRYSDLPENEQKQKLRACRELADQVYGGLDLSREINAVNTQRLGDTVLLSTEDRSELVGFAVCHCGSGSEAGDNNCYVKFGVARPGQDSSEVFERLLDCCEALGAERGLSLLTAGVNTGRHEAYRKMIAHGFRSDFQGVAMERPNEPGYNRPDVYLIDDQR